MTALCREVEKHLKSGYLLVKVDGTMYGVRDPAGNEITVNGKPFRFSGRLDTNHLRRRILSTLRDAGAVPAPQRKAKERHEPVKMDTEAPNAIITAKGILQDTRATPRERKMAKAYLELLDQHQKVRTLAATLGKAVRRME